MVVPPLHFKWTREGDCRFREISLHLGCEMAFRKAWKERKIEWLRRGFSLRNMNGRWLLQQWLRVDGENLTLTPIGQEKVDAFSNPQAALDLQVEESEVKLDLPELPADIEAKLFEYQIEPARQIFRALQKGESEWGYPGAWDSSDMGTGKTYQSLAAALATGLEVAVVCPLAVIPAWKRAFAHFGHHPLFVMNYESLRTGNRQWVKIEQIEGGRQFVWKMKPQDTCIIFDEAHMMKSVGKRTQALGIAAIRQRFPLIFASGTLARDPTEMRASGRIAGLHTGGNDFERFLEEHNCRKNGGDAYKFIGGRNGRAALQRIHRKVFPARGARVRIVDLGDRFPETQIRAESFDTGETAKIAQAFRDAEEMLARLEQQGMNAGEVARRKASVYMEAWHASERLKVPALVEMARLEIEEGRSVAFFVNFTDVRLELMKSLKTDCAIFGGQPPFAREDCIKRFQEDQSRVIVANIDAGGVGVSLHDVNGEHPRTSIILPTNKVVSLTQALGRVHRAGGKSRSRQIVFFAAGTIEEQICEVIRKRMAQIGTLNDGELYPKAKF